MKKLLVIFMLISSPLMADSIPGWIELDISYQKWVAAVDSKFDYSNIEIDFKYGAEFSYFKPYMLFNTQTYFETSDKILSNYPFYDKYNIGLGLEINNIFYIEAMHTCAHKVYSAREYNHAMYASMRSISHNHIKVGLKFKID